MATAMKIYCLICTIALISCANQPTNKSGSEADEAAHSSVPMEQDSTPPSDSLALSKLELTKHYVQSIADYIKAMKKDYAMKFDTLYFGKHVYGQPDDFPDVEQESGYITPRWGCIVWEPDVTTNIAPRWGDSHTELWDTIRLQTCEN